MKYINPEKLKKSLQENLLFKDDINITTPSELIEGIIKSIDDATEQSA